MINKFIKIIHNKYYSFFKFFFLRYLFTIFFIAITLYLIIPSFFNYEKKSIIIKDYIKDNYNYEINKYEKIEFKSLPLPRLELKNVSINLNSSPSTLNVDNLKIYPKFLSIYNYENFQLSKIEINDSSILLETSNLNFLISHILNQNKNLSFNNFNLKIIDKKKPIISLEKIKFSNFGYNKNLFKGEIFKKKFRIKVSNNLDNIDFKLINSGINANIKFNEKSKKDSLIGVLKSKILNSNLKFNFNLGKDKVHIHNLYFRNKNLSFNNDSTININPFLDFDTRFEIEDINFDIVKKIDFNKLLDSKNIIKRINSKNEINFKAKKFSRNLIDKFKLKINLAYGRVNYLKSFSISNNHFNCNGNINLLQEFPLLFFDCSITSENKSDFLKIFSVKIKDKDEALKINITGNLNLRGNKINFKKISMNNIYIASKEDLKYFKETFEDTVLDSNFFEIFKFNKINKFVLEIS